MITEEMGSKWREEFEAIEVLYIPHPMEMPRNYFEKNLDGEYRWHHIREDWQIYLSAKESSQEEIDELKGFIRNKCGEPYENLTTKTDARSMVKLHMEQANEYFHKQLDERDELIKEAVVYIETIRAINNLPGYRINDGEKQFKDWLSKAKTILGEK